MNNQNCGFQNVDNNFSVDMPKASNDILQSFQGGVGMDLNFPQHNFPMHSDNYYQQKQQNDNMVNVTDHLVQNVVYPNTGEPSLNSALPNNQLYCAELSNLNVSSLPFTGNLQNTPGPFINSLSQAQELSNELQPAEFSSQSGIFSNNSSARNDCSNIQQLAADNMEGFSSTAEYLDNSSKSLYCQTNSNLEASADRYPSCNVSFPDQTRRDEYTNANASTFPPCNGSSLYSTDASLSVAAVSQSNYNEAFITASTTSTTSNAEIASCDQDYTMVPAVTVEPTSSKDLNLYSLENSMSSKSVQHQTNEMVSSPYLEPGNGEYNLCPDSNGKSQGHDEVLVSSEASTINVDKQTTKECDRIISLVSECEENSYRLVSDHSAIQPPNSSVGNEEPIGLNGELSKKQITETLDDVSNSLEKGIEASLDVSTMEFDDPSHTDNTECTKPLSPINSSNSIEEGIQSSPSESLEKGIEESLGESTLEFDDPSHTDNTECTKPPSPINSTSQASPSKSLEKGIEESLGESTLEFDDPSHTDNTECAKPLSPINSTSNSIEEGIQSSPSKSLEKGIEESLGESTMEGDNTEPSRPLSPMITVLDGDFDGTESKFKPEDSSGPQEDLKKCADSDTNVRVTRLRTGSLPVKPSKNQQNTGEDLAREYFDSDDSYENPTTFEDWMYPEGSEMAPCKVHPSVSVPERVLQVTPEEIEHYVKTFGDGIGRVLQSRLHCTVCGKHIGAAPSDIHLGNRHKVLRVLICNKCQSFYGKGKFRKDKDGYELYCRWCGQGGEVICCSSCPNVFCQPCIKRNFGPVHLKTITESNDWACFVCNYQRLWDLRAICWALLTFTMQKKREALDSKDGNKIAGLQDDFSTCCSHKRRKTQDKIPQFFSRLINSPRSTDPENQTLNGASVQFGHFLLDDDVGSTSAMGPQENMEETTRDEDEFIDPSQFVQSVLEEPHTSQTRVRSTPFTARQFQQPSAGPIRQSVLHAVPVTLNTNPPRVVYRSGSPRIVIRQGNLMQPGLVPINNQPNRIGVSGVLPIPGTSLVRNNQSNRPQMLSQSRPTGRNPGSLLNNIDGVRSIDQMQSLDQVPWFRDGIDSIRAVGFALTKRIRELEARFHSLKNKQDVEKVMVLGKKLQRLGYVTERRFNQINLNLKNDGRSWSMKRTNNANPRMLDVNPFSLYDESLSDWNDEAELSKPLEKVMIPVSSASIQGGGVRPLVSTRALPPLVRANVPLTTPLRGTAPLRGGTAPLRGYTVPLTGGTVPLRGGTVPLRGGTVPLRGRTGPLRGGTVPQRGGTVPLRGGRVPQVFFRGIGRPPSTAQNASGQPFPVRTAVSSTNPPTFTRVRLPGPKSSVSRYVNVENKSSNVSSLLTCNITRAVGVLLNEKNGKNSVSITLASNPKRKRVDSDTSDVMVCPTIPELLKMHNIKPCQVRLERCDGFIEAFLTKQKQTTSQSTSICDVADTIDYDCDTVVAPEKDTILLSPDPLCVSEVETDVLSCDVSYDQSTSSAAGFEKSNKDSTTNNESIDDDDDIEIIHVVSNVT